MGPFVSSFTLVLVTFILMLSVSISGVFNHVELDIGLEHYAEIPWIPLIETMPLNTLVNIGYICVGMYWCAFTETASSHGVLKDHDTHLFYAFNLMASLYGCVQTARIITQDIVWAVLDQWCTLPFFALLLVWGLYYRFGWSHKCCIFIFAFSIFSYALTLATKIGFEICLGCHIIGAIVGGMLAYYKHPATGSLFYFYAALISCFGFVVLKLLDFKLASTFFIFKYVSGHFLSKICDVYQIYFVNSFFFDLALQKAVDLSVEDKYRWISRDEEIRKVRGNDIRYENPVTLKAKRL